MKAKDGFFSNKYGFMVKGLFFPQNYCVFWHKRNKSLFLNVFQKLGIFFDFRKNEKSWKFIDPPKNEL